MAEVNVTKGGFDHHAGLAAPFATEDTFWGYKVLSGKSPAVSVMVGQAISFFFGVCLMTATFGVLVLPTLFFDGDAGFFRIGASVVMGAMGTYLLWFASRGSVPVIHVDTKAREIREVVANRSGKPSVIGVHAFDDISGIELEIDHDTGQAQLLLAQNHSAHAICVAVGTEAQLLPLRDRLVQDLLGQAQAGATSTV